jgi:3-deoxy-manno-octulosonate cytidylyltransferase (CMP-KDO synthetase)
MLVKVIIPARYKSTRFPGKSLIDINGKPMIIRVVEIACKAVGKENVFVATDDERISDVIEDYGYNYIMTTDCPSGTDRVAQASRLMEADIVLNVQGDEPLLNPNDIERVIEHKKKHMDSVVNCMSKIDSEEANNVNTIKVVTNYENDLIYMSRSPIPATKVGLSDNTYKQVCIYAFTKEQLEKFYKMKKTLLELDEDIDILRFLEMGINVKMIETFGTTQAVDIPEDVDKVIGLINVSS